MPEDRAPIDDLLHRVNNLLGTIQMQTEVARTLDAHDAYRRALELIEESARRTHAEVQKFRRRAGDAAAGG